MDPHVLLVALPGVGSKALSLTFQPLGEEVANRLPFRAERQPPVLGAMGVGKLALDVCSGLAVQVPARSVRE
jgi:hypothetical protein